MNGTSIKKATYTVYNTGANDIKVDNQVISPNRSYTVTYEASLSSTGTVITPAKNLEVTSVDGKTTSVKVIATGIAINTDGKDYAFTAKEATATFTATSEVPASYTGVVAEFNSYDSGKNNNTITFAGKNPVKYAGESGKTYKYFGANGNEVFSEVAFEALLRQYVGNSKVTLSYSVDGDTKTFKVITVDSTAPVADRIVENTSPTAVNSAPTAKAVGAQTIEVGGTALTFTTSQLAEDVDAGDTLTVLSAYTSNPTIATASTNGTSITVSPVAAGTTTVTAVVADSHNATVNVTFNVTVAPQVYVKTIGNPARSYVAATPGKLTLVAPTVTTDGNLVVGDGTVTHNVNLLSGATVADIVTAINNQANAIVTATATNNGADIEVALKAAGGTLSLEADATLAGNNIPVNGTPATNAGTAATKAAYSFQVNAVPTVGKVITVKVGTQTYNYTVTAGDTSATVLAGNIATLIGAANTNAGEYNATAAGAIVTLEQAVAAPTTGISLTVSNN